NASLRSPLGTFTGPAELNGAAVERSPTARGKDEFHLVPIWIRCVHASPMGGSKGDPTRQRLPFVPR
ncbi:MAG TPA: hypothetical protein PLX89_23100, partial [Verrucomicrobiota bacterium]|nr:hypothetical protein [Verrucomicrobiota bacterium]